jgi:flagellar biosynthesis protein FlhB
VSDRAERRYDPTPTRRERALREGNVARSAELGGTVAFGAAVLAALLGVSLVAANGAAALRATAAHPLAGPPGFALFGIAQGAALPAAGAALGGIALGLAQARGVRLVAIKFDLARLSPAAGVKRMFGGEALVHVARAALAFAAALGAMVPLGWDVLGAASAPASPLAAASLVGRAALRACGAAFVVGAVFALADYALARRRWLHGLRMSFEEIKRDAKENDGDPQAKARRKSLHRALVRGAIARTREASFVVVNPTHVAVALRYAPPAVPVPEILVRSLDEAALRVKAIAREHAIPIVEDVALARLLYVQGESGRAIPPETYVAVAQIIASLARAGVLDASTGSA